MKILSYFALILLGGCSISDASKSVRTPVNIVSYQDLMNNKQYYDGKPVVLKAYFSMRSTSKKLNKTEMLLSPGLNPEKENECQYAELGSLIIDTKGIVRLKKHTNEPDNEQAFAREMIVRGIFSAKPTNRWSIAITTFDASLKDAEIITASPTSNWCVFP